MRVLCTICARGGSKGVPGKNSRVLAGKPLIVHTIEQALATPGLARVVVSTDDPGIARIARDAGAEAPFLRPAELATDTAPKIPVLQHALRSVEAEEGATYDRVLDLDPTSPLRRPEDIAGAMARLEEAGADVVFSVTEAQRNPYFNMVELDPAGWARLCKVPERPIARRQDAPRVYSLNASIYVYRRDALLAGTPIVGPRSAVWVMPEEASIDLDREVDFMIVEMLMERRRGA